MKTLEFECDDRYEAEKLASLVSVQKDNTVGFQVLKQWLEMRSSYN